MSPLNRYLIIHFFVGLFVFVADESGQLTYSYWLMAGMYLVAKEYVKGIRWLFCPNRKNYFYVLYPAAVIAFAFAAFGITQAGLSNEPFFFKTFFFLFLLVVGHLISFPLLCITYFFIRIPITLHRRRVEERQRRQAEIQAQRAYEERRRLDIEREIQTRQVAARQASDDQRRIDARAECDLFYDQHLKEVAKRFPRPMFQHFMDTYLSDQQPVEAVERRAKELRRVIQFHRDAAKPPAKFQSMQEVTDWFLHEKQSLETLPINDEMREEQSIWLEQRYAELTQSMLEKIG